MKSNRQRRAEIKAKRVLRAGKKVKILRFRNLTFSTGDCAPVDPHALMASNSYEPSQFVVRGYYLPVAFTCRDCGSSEIWTAKQQKLWYEKWHGTQFTTAVRCRPCRAIKRAQKIHSEAMRVAGILDKQKSKNHEHAN